MRSWLTLRYYAGIRMEGLWKTTKNLRQDSWSPSRDLNPGPPEYEAGLLTTRQRSERNVLNIGLWYYGYCTFGFFYRTNSYNY
jgi:hypothetical protein